MISEAKLDFAYRYPFSQEAKEVVASLHAESVDENYLKEGLRRLRLALEQGEISHGKVVGLSDVKYRYIMGYVYARMLVSAVGDRFTISRFAAAEAKTARATLELDTPENLVKIANELGLGARKEDGEFAVQFEKFVSVPKKDGRLRLVNEKLAGGIVRLDRESLLRLVSFAAERDINVRLPIDRRELPREIIEAAKGIRPQEPRITFDASRGTYAWIEKLLATPIADVRHRSVNLIFAPYLANVKRLEEESAVKTIVDYIERCKQINPNTRINESYIRYQVRYARNKGMRPLSLVRAREMLKGIAEFE